MPKVSKKDQVLAFWQKNTKLSVKEIANKLDMHYATVRHALKDKLDVVSQTKKSANKAKTVKELPTDDPRVVAMKQGDIACFCPKCGKPAAARICSAILVGEHYEISASGQCKHKKCQQHFTMYNVERTRSHAA